MRRLGIIALASLFALPVFFGEAGSAEAKTALQRKNERRGKAAKARSAAKGRARRAAVRSRAKRRKLSNRAKRVKRVKSRRSRVRKTR